MGYAEIYEPVGTIVAVLIVAFVSARQVWPAIPNTKQLKDSTKKDTCKAYRNGQVTVIEVDDVVVGERVLLQSGIKIPADGILVDGDLRADNSALNGEAEECKKFAAKDGGRAPEQITGETFVHLSIPCSVGLWFLTAKACWMSVRCNRNHDGEDGRGNAGR